MLWGDRKQPSENGPQIAALVAHLKCELFKAANSTENLPYYGDVPTLPPLSGPTTEVRRRLTLQNFFKEIEYVGEASFTLDVTQTGGLNSLNSASKYYSGSIGDIPATGAYLSVGGNLSEASHRYFLFNLSVDFARLVETEVPPFDNIKPAVPIVRVDGLQTCTEGSELAGDLRMKDIIASGVIVNAMSDVTDLNGAVIPNLLGSSTPAAPIAVPSTYSFGQFAVQNDFTIVEGINGGPNWILKYLTTPGSPSGGLFNFSRTVKDTLVMTFVPVCIRQKYWTDSKGAPFEYRPMMIEGTPAWANLLPPCGTNALQAQVNAAAKGLQNNFRILLQNSPLFQASTPSRS